MKSAVLVAALLFFSVSAFSQPQSKAQMPTDTETATQQAILDAGVKQLTSGQPAAAIADSFDKVIAFYEARIAGSTTRYYAARTQAETLLYLLEAANAKTGAVVVKSTFAYAYYLRAYALTELNRHAEARASLESAIAMSPRNAQFQGELGDHYARAKNWDASLATFRVADAAAREFSPEDLRKAELGRALRGQGYALVELSRLQDAEEIYKKCLELDPNDRRALAELRLVQSRKQK